MGSDEFYPEEAVVDVSGEHYVDLELEALAMMKWEWLLPVLVVAAPPLVRLGLRVPGR